MKALGMIETIGMVGAIEALDAALKTADVDILNGHIIKGGIVTVEIVGDVGAIKVAVEAGAEAAKRLGVFVGSHVIARPDEMVFKMIEEDGMVQQNKEDEKVSNEVIEEIKDEVKEIKVEEIIEVEVEPKTEEVIETIETKEVIEIVTETEEKEPKIQEIKEIIKEEVKTEKTEKKTKNKTKKK